MSERILYISQADSTNHNNINIIKPIEDSEYYKQILLQQLDFGKNYDNFELSNFFNLTTNNFGISQNQSNPFDLIILNISIIKNSKSDFKLMVKKNKFKGKKI